MESHYVSIDLSCATKSRIARMERMRKQHVVSILLSLITTDIKYIKCQYKRVTYICLKELLFFFLNNNNSH